MNNCIIKSEQELDSIAKDLINEVKNNYFDKLKYIALNGDLGSGKTTLVRYIIRNFNYQGRVKSPTYSFVETYSIDNSFIKFIHHFDIYRFTNQSMWLEYGFDEYLQPDALIFIEWPQLALNFLPIPIINLNINLLSNNHRLISY